MIPLVAIFLMTWEPFSQMLAFLIYFPITPTVMSTAPTSFAITWLSTINLKSYWHFKNLKTKINKWKKKFTVVCYFPKRGAATLADVFVVYVVTHGVHGCFDDPRLLCDRLTCCPFRYVPDCPATRLAYFGTLYIFVDNRDNNWVGLFWIENFTAFTFINIFNWLI